MRLVDLAVPAPLGRPLTYSIPDGVNVARGMRVVATLRKTRIIAIAIKIYEGDPPHAVKPIVKVLDERPTLPEDLLAFLLDVARYYVAPVGEVLALALPPIEREADRETREPTLFDDARGVGDRKVQIAIPTSATSETKIRGQALSILERLRATGEASVASLERDFGNARSAVKKLASEGLVRLEERSVEVSPFTEAIPRDVPPKLTVAQERAVESVRDAISKNEPKTLLLHGVTGSGKTEVYLRAITLAREAGRGAIVLVPEIALTPQLVSRFRARFGDDVGVIHSGLTPKERFVMWRRLRAGELDVAVGARSALFAPVSNLGLVIVDEEHDPSFKQEEGVRYHARDMAILRSHAAKGVVILGSATPSLESIHLADTGRAERLILPERATAQTLPTVELVDLRRTGPGPSGDRHLSIHLHRAIQATLARGEQTILFLNRRGFAPSVVCAACGAIAECPNCAVALTFHKVRGGELHCHYCDYARRHDASCKKCQAPSLLLEGQGTSRLEELLVEHFPGARVARLDRDTATGKTIGAILDRVRRGEVDILVGTQMVTKGHDLPSVTLVGVVNADAALSMPDFRAAERTFQLLVQVAGRAGRGDKPGRVLVQTYNPEHPALVRAKAHDVVGFLGDELSARRELGYPPFSRLALVRIDDPDEGRARAAATALARAAEGGGERDVRVLGPTPAPIPRLRNRYRFRVLLRSRERPPIYRLLRIVLAAKGELPRTTRVIIDVDPVNLL